MQTTLQGAAMCIPTAIGIIGYTIPPGRVKNYSFAFYSGGAPTGQVLGNLLVEIHPQDRVLFLISLPGRYHIAIYQLEGCFLRHCRSSVYCQRDGRVCDSKGASKNRELSR